MIKDWSNYNEFTKLVFDPEGLLANVAVDLGLKAYLKDYYSIDGILYEDKHKLNSTHFPEILDVWTYFRHITVAFEHENDFYSGIWNETAHLLITNCDLRVLVSYPCDPSGGKGILDGLHDIIRGHHQCCKIAKKESFLIILGDLNRNESQKVKVEWKGLVFKMNNWKEIRSPK